MKPLRKQKQLIQLLAVLYLPLVIAARLSKQRNVIADDLLAMNRHCGLGYGFCLSLVYHVRFNMYYRNVLYNRMGGGRIWSVFYPRVKSFFPCKQIGGGVYLAHPFSTILNAQSIGKNFSCRQCTTIGNKRDGDGSSTSPVIGDNVTVGANVCIIGNITVGNNVIIGAGAVVVKDVPDGAVIAGNPARIIGKTES